MQKLNQQPGEREPPKALVTGWVRRSRDQDMFLCLSSAKKTEATLSAYKGKTLMQGIGYAIDRRDCEGNQVADEGLRAERSQEAVVPHELEGQREQVNDPLGSPGRRYD